MSNSSIWQMFINGRWHEVSAKEAAICAVVLGHPVRLAAAPLVRVSTR